MSLLRKIKQRFCRHIDDPSKRNKMMPFKGYMFQCPKCNGYVAYFESGDKYFNISEWKRDIFLEEGFKCWAAGWNWKEEGAMDVDCN